MRYKGTSALSSPNILDALPRPLIHLTMRQNASILARKSARSALLRQLESLSHQYPARIGLEFLAPVRRSVSPAKRAFTSQHVADQVSSSLPKIAAVQDDTIYALSTAPGRAGIAIVRISGPACLDVLCPTLSIPPSWFSFFSRYTEPSVHQN